MTAGTALLDALVTLKHALLDLKAQQLAGHIVDEASYAAAASRRAAIPGLRKRFHLLTKAIDDVDRGRMERWRRAQRHPRRPTLEEWQKQHPRPRHADRGGRGRFLKRNPVEHV